MMMFKKKYPRIEDAEKEAEEKTEEKVEEKEEEKPAATPATATIMGPSTAALSADITRLKAQLRLV